MASSVTGLWGSVNYDENGKRIVNDKSSSKSTSNELDKNAFLKLLMTQLQYQDPLNPTDDKQFLAQMAQFTMVEQMQNMSQTSQETSSFSLIGKYVDTLTYNKTTFTSEEVSGLVSAVSKMSGEIYLTIDGKQVLASSVVNVYPDYVSSQISTINSSVLTSQNISLIGKHVQAITIDSENNPTGFVEGKVDYVKFDSDGSPVLVVDGKEVFGIEVISVSDRMMLLGKEIQYEERDPETNETKIITGKIDEIKFDDEKAYMVVDGKQILLEKINYVTDALNYVGNEISHKDISGNVDGVLMIDGYPYLRVGESLISYKTYKGIK